jgi:hypothetical protein
LNHEASSERLPGEGSSNGDNFDVGQSKISPSFYTQELPQILVELEIRQPLARAHDPKIVRNVEESDDPKQKNGRELTDREG